MHKILLSAVFLLAGATVAMAGDPINNTVINETPFQITTSAMTLNFFDANTLDEATKTITFGSGTASYSEGGQVGWDYSSYNPSYVDVSSYKYLIVSLNNSAAPSAVEARLCNTSDGSAWYVPFCTDGTTINNIVSGSNHVDIDLQNANFTLNDAGTVIQTTISKLYNLKFWECYGNTNHKMNLSNVFLTNTKPNWSVPVTRSTASGEFGTICLPYPATMENAYIYTVSGISADGKTVYLTHYNGLIQAGVPYIYKSLSADGVKFYQIEDDGVKATAGTTENGLTGCLTETTGLSSKYACSGTDVTETSTCAANQAYLDISGLSTVTSGDEKLTVNATPITTTSIYTDEYTPLYSSQMTLNIFRQNSFDDATKTITFVNDLDPTSTTGGRYYAGSAGWTYSTAKDFTAYQYLVMAFNPQANSYYTINLRINDTAYNPYDNTNTKNIDLRNGTKHVDLDMQNGYFITGSTISKITFDKVNQVAFWDSWEDDNKLSLANVFLTNTLPDWNNPVTRTTTSGNYGTVCLAYPAICTDGYVYQIKSINSAKTKIGIEPYNGVMKAGVPYIYKSIGDGVNFYEIKDSRVLASVGGSNNGLIGCLNATTSITKNSNLYVLHNNMWYLVNSDNFSSAANRAYIDISQIATVDNTLAKGMTMDLSEEITGVNTINVSNNGEEEATYTITGVKLGKDATLQRGIYIRGGKKFVVK